MTSHLHFEGARLMLTVQPAAPREFSAPQGLENCAGRLQNQQLDAYQNARAEVSQDGNGGYTFQARKQEFRAGMVSLDGSLHAQGSDKTRVRIHTQHADVTGSLWRLLAVIGLVAVGIYIQGLSLLFLLLIPMALPILVLHGVVGARYHQELLIELMQKVLAAENG